MTDMITAPLMSLATTGNQVLAVRVDETLACIDLDAVERTFSLVALQAVPGAAHWVAGIMNYAGSSLAVIDLALRLGLPARQYDIDTPIVVCEWGEQRLGLIVSDIVGIQSPAPADVQLADSFQRRGAAFRASLHTSLGLALLLDMDWLMDADIFGCDNPEFQGARLTVDAETASRE